MKAHYDKINESNEYSQNITVVYICKILVECEVQTSMATSDYDKSVRDACERVARASASPDSLDVTTILPLEKKENIIQPS